MATYIQMWYREINEISDLLDAMGEYFRAEVNHDMPQYAKAR